MSGPTDLSARTMIPLSSKTLRKVAFLALIFWSVASAKYLFGIAECGGDEMDAIDAIDRTVAANFLPSFEPSLIAKENIEFLIRPGILIRESMNQEVIISYPAD